MKKATDLFRGTGILGATAILFAVVWCASVQGAAQMPQMAEEPRADLITIDTLKTFGPLERPPVFFKHDKHTDALAKQNKDCSVCHLSSEKGQSIKFKRLVETNKKAVMEIYHTDCISCHKETSAADLKSGPVTCGECHLEHAPVASNWQPIGMDKSLHYRHVKSQENKCEKCHHDYNTLTKSLFYAKGEEGTCRYCHKDVTEENRISLRLAAHQGCVECHRTQLAQKRDAGPLQCSGCHDPEEQQMIEVVKDVPRMQRNQPDTVFVKRTTKATPVEATSPNTPMSMVPFNHKAHEQYNTSCRVCHHADLNTCAQCHTPIGSKDGNFVNSQQAMHQLRTEQSCVGCHSIQQQAPQCAGCHYTINPSVKQKTENCLACHVMPPEGADVAASTLDDKEQAKLLLDARPSVTATYADADVPEIVEIKALSYQYGPAELPHRKIVRALEKASRESKLASYFHREPGTLCQGCHHHSPAAKKPPQCSSCHGQPFDAKKLDRPGLMAAYHQQCMDCHAKMQLEKPAATDCIACHKKK